MEKGAPPPLTAISPIRTSPLRTVPRKAEKLTPPVILRKFRTLIRILLTRLRSVASFMKALPRHARKVRRIVGREGWRGLWYAFEERFHLADRELYEIWQRRHRLTAGDRDRILREMEKMALRPLISILLPVYNTDEAWLRKCLDSVLSQIYPRWELCICRRCLHPAPCPNRSRGIPRR